MNKISSLAENRNVHDPECVTEFKGEIKGCVSLTPGCCT